LILAGLLALIFGVSNGISDSANSVSALVATRAARPAKALSLAAAFQLFGGLLAGSAVAVTIGGLVRLPRQDMAAAVGAALSGALAWNLISNWRGLPTSSGHGLVGGLIGAAIVSGGAQSVVWGSPFSFPPKGVGGAVVSLALSPILGFTAGLLLSRGARVATRRATRHIERPIRRAELATASAVAFSNGANDSQKTMAMIVLLLMSAGRIEEFFVPFWVRVAGALALGVGTGVAGWRTISTVGSGIYRIRSLDGLVSQASSAGVILASAAVGGPVSTTHVVTASVVGVGTSQRRRHVRWRVVGEMAVAWLVTLPLSALLAAASMPLWRLMS
jgi:PiT family inorganic phosphate transporter